MNIKLESRISRRRVTLPKRIQRRRQNPKRIPTTTAKQPANRSFDEQRYGFKAYDDWPTGLRRLESDPASVVVAVDGACRNNGRAGARGWLWHFLLCFCRPSQHQRYRTTCITSNQPICRIICHDASAGDHSSIDDCRREHLSRDREDGFGVFVERVEHVDLEVGCEWVLECER